MRYTRPRNEVVSAPEDYAEKALNGCYHFIRRKQVKAWRDQNYEVHQLRRMHYSPNWFKEYHIFIHNTDGSSYNFRYYFHKEALETVVWLYEVAKVKR